VGQALFFALAGIAIADSAGDGVVSSVHVPVSSLVAPEPRLYEDRPVAPHASLSKWLMQRTWTGGSANCDTPS
jgi:hypothetical protein